MHLKRKGFTLIEMVVVILIVGILSSLALPNYRRSVERARVAEAQTLLRAIYDSCERFAWENGKNNCAASVVSTEESSRATFRKLDIAAKGTFSTDGKTLSTGNFNYNLTGVVATPVTAVATKGAYTGASITFSGQNFACTAGSATAEAAKACEVWGASTWNL